MVLTNYTVHQTRRYIKKNLPKNNFIANMSGRNRKHTRSSSSAVSERSLSSLSDAVIEAGRKAKQKAIKTVQSFTALLKKPRRSHIRSDEHRKFWYLYSSKRLTID
jgi:hypothetical protein